MDNCLFILTIGALARLILIYVSSLKIKCHRIGNKTMVVLFARVDHGNQYSNNESRKSGVSSKRDEKEVLVQEVETDE